MQSPPLTQGSPAVFPVKQPKPVHTSVSGNLLKPFQKRRPERPKAAVAERDVALQTGQAELLTGKGSELAIWRYPTFAYNAEGGGGTAVARRDGGARVHLEFDCSKLKIPAVTWANARFLGLPLPPGLRITILPQRLEGYIDTASGEVRLNFTANFVFNASVFYKAKPLFVETVLTTESVKGRFHSKKGSRLDKEGFAVLVGIARLEKIDSLFMDNFLHLPTECLAVMSSHFRYSL